MNAIIQFFVLLSLVFSMSLGGSPNARPLRVDGFCRLESGEYEFYVFNENSYDVDFYYRSGGALHGPITAPAFSSAQVITTGASLTVKYDLVGAPGQKSSGQSKGERCYGPFEQWPYKEVEERSAEMEEEFYGPPIREVIPDGYSGMGVYYYDPGVGYRVLFVLLEPVEFSCGELKEIINPYGKFYVLDGTDKCYPLFGYPGSVKLYTSASIWPGDWLIEDGRLSYHPGVCRSDVEQWLVEKFSMTREEATKLSVEWRLSEGLDLSPYIQ